MECKQTLVLCHRHFENLREQAAGWWDGGRTTGDKNFIIYFA